MSRSFQQLLGGRREMMLQGLRLHRPDDVQPDGRSDQAAKVIEDEEAQRGLQRNFKPAKGRPEDRGEMGEGRRRARRPEIRNLRFEDPLNRRQKRTSLRTARAIRDMVRCKGVAKLIQPLQPLWLSMSRAHEWQRRTAELMQTRLDVGKKLPSISNFTVLPCCFESERVGEAAGGERGVGELPEEELIFTAETRRRREQSVGNGFFPAPRLSVSAVHQNKKYRCANGSTFAGSQVSSSPSACTA